MVPPSLLVSPSLSLHVTTSRGLGDRLTARVQRGPLRPRVARAKAITQAALLSPDLSGISPLLSGISPYVSFVARISPLAPQLEIEQYERRLICMGVGIKMCHGRMTVMGHVQPALVVGLRQRLAKQFTFAGAVVDEQNGRGHGVRVR